MFSAINRCFLTAAINRWFCWYKSIFCCYKSIFPPIFAAINRFLLFATYSCCCLLIFFWWCKSSMLLILAAVCDRFSLHFLFYATVVCYRLWFLYVTDFCYSLLLVFVAFCYNFLLLLVTNSCCMLLTFFHYKWIMLMNFVKSTFFVLVFWNRIWPDLV